MHAVKNGIVALGISLSLSSFPATAQYRAAPRPQSAPAPTTHAASPVGQPAGRVTQAVAQGVAHGSAQRGSAPGTVRQVAGQHAPHGAHTAHRAHAAHAPAAPRNSSGFLGGWFGGDESPKPARGESRSLLQRLGIGDDEPSAAPVHAAAATEVQPDWEGVPYHRPQRSALAGRAAAGGAAPITDPKDPSNRQLSERLAQPSPTGAASSPATSPSSRAAVPSSRTAVPSSRTVASSQIPVPPTEESLRTSRRESTPEPSSEALSDTQSSRRSGRRVVDPLDAYLDAAPAAASNSPVRADGQGPIADRGLASGPRVARRPVPAVSNAATSRRRTSATAEATAGTSMPPSLAAAGERDSQPGDAAATKVPLVSPSAQSPSAPSPSASATAAAPATGAAAEGAVPAIASPETVASEQAPSVAAAADAKAATSPQTASTSAPQVNPLTASSDAWQASGVRTSTTPTAAAGSTSATSSPPASSTAQNESAPSESAPSEADSIKADSSDTAAAARSQLKAQPQLGVRARTSGDSSLDNPETVTSVNTQPVNVVAEIPGIRVVTSGPAEIPIRQGVNYEIRVENRGSMAAPGALVRVSLPRWIGVQSQKASRGEIAEESSQRELQLLWQVEGLPASSSETLVLALSASEARQFDVAVEWAVLPQSNIAHVQVLEPKLELVIDGPDQVVFGESQTYKVRVLNPGNGNAENVVFTLSPNSKTPQSQQIGSIPAGKEAQFEVELTARDRESLQIHGLAVGTAGLESELTKSIDVVAADLEAVLSGPPLRYQASSAAYKLEISNHGDATCETLVAVLRLPAGVKYEGGLPQTANASVSSDSIQWQVGQLAPGESTEFEFHCLMQETGEQKIAFECEGTAAGSASVAFTTTVETLADLVLSVDDPTAPAPVGEEVRYEIVLRNRGSKAAADVQVLAQFSHDVEPVRVEGAAGKVAPGQVVFDPIPRVEPGAELRLTVVAKAEKAGLHRFRSEVRSGETLLVSEESTRYIELAGERVSQRSSETETK